MADFNIAEGDTAPLVDTLLDPDGAGKDINGADVRFQMISPSAASFWIDAAANNDQAGAGTEGNVSYDWATGETDEPGTYLARWVVTFADLTVQTYPNDGWFTILVSADIPGSTEAFATSSDLEARLGVEFTAAEHVRATRLLARASDLIRDATGQTISFVEADTLTRLGNNTGRVVLPQRPVGEVATVTRNGTLLDAESYYVIGDVLTTSAPYGFMPSIFGSVLDDLEIVYSHGYESIPGQVVAICMEVVARVWNNPAKLVSETTGNASATYGDDGTVGLLLTQTEREQLVDALAGSVGTTQLR